MYNLKFFSESRRPVPAWLLQSSVAAALSLPLVMTARLGLLDPVHILTALLVSGAGFYGWWISPLSGKSISSDSSKRWLHACMGAAFAGVLTVWILFEDKRAHALWPLLPFALMLVYVYFGKKSMLMRHVLVPLLFGSAVMFAGALTGHPEISAFPAVIGVLFVSVLRFTLDIEEDVFEHFSDHPALEVQTHYRARLGVAAIIFFLFGTVSLWPWLGMMYGQGYFWLLLVGVLLPLVFFWGRIRQPKMEGARTALIRFNRIAPIIGFLHILAILIA